MPRPVVLRTAKVVPVVGVVRGAHPLVAPVDARPLQRAPTGQQRDLRPRVTVCDRVMCPRTELVRWGRHVLLTYLGKVNVQAEPSFPIIKKFSS